MVRKMVEKGKRNEIAADVLTGALFGGIAGVIVGVVCLVNTEIGLIFPVGPGLALVEGTLLGAFSGGVFGALSRFVNGR